MKTLKHFLHGLFIIPALWHSAAAQTLDPTFAPPSMYAPGIVLSAVEQPDGKRVVTGIFNRVDGTPAWGVSRFDTNGTLDAAFQQNVGIGAYGYRLRLLSNGQFFVVYPGSSTSAPLVAGGISRLGALRLNADGTGDASFDPGTGPSAGGFIDDLLPLPGGKSLAVGVFDHFNGAVANGIVRLNTNGTVDATFNSGLGAASGDDIERIVALPNGQFLASGYITSYNGVACDGGIIRLNADGSLDPTFVSGLGTGSVVDNMVVQPDGRIIVASLLSIGGNNTPNIARLMPNGALDASFTPPTFQAFSITSRYGDALQLQSDGKIIVLNSFPATGSAMSSVVRLNTDGTLDTSFQVGTKANNGPSSALLLANGKILVMGGFTAFSGVPDRPLVQLTSTGAVDPSFQPAIQTTGSVAAVVRQADGKLIVGGSFSQINGQTVRRLARFNTDGTLDATFTPPSLDARVVDLALQPDGRFLAAQPAEVHRYLATGQLDNTYSPPSFSGSQLTRLLLQADGRVLAGGSVLKSNGTTAPQGFMRLLDTGAIDASFAPANSSAGGFVGFQAMAQQPDGKLVVAGQVSSGTTIVRTVMRLTTTGASDAGFSGREFANVATTGSSSVQTLAVQPDGKILAGGAFSAYGTTTLSNIVRLNTDGTPDAGFTAPTTTGTVNTLVLQPNSRILVGGAFTSPSLATNLARLLANGTADASFGATAVPNSSVNALLVQPDGKLVAGGAFATLSGLPSMGVARLTVANVLAVAAPKAVADRTEAWPVPAHTSLNVAFDATAHPQALDLTDVLGRPLLHQPLSGGSQATLPLSTLSAGTYLLRVTYAEGLVVRRIQVQ